MDLGSPISSVIPSGHGVVLVILARTGTPLSGRRIAELTGGRLGRSRTLAVLNELVGAGLALAERHPPAVLFSLNRDHVAAEAVVVLADLRGRTIDRLRAALTAWDPPPVSAWLFGSAARGDGTPRSDIDIAVIRPDGVAVDDDAWASRLSALSDAVVRWTGNEASVLDFCETEFRTLADSGERIVADIRRDGVLLAGTQAPVRRKASARR